MTFLYAISNAPGRLVSEGRVDDIGEAGEAFDRHVYARSGKFRKDAQGMAEYKDGPSGLRHLTKGVWSMTTLPENSKLLRA